jgi:hypothetical protein
MPFAYIRQIAKITFILMQLYFAAWRNRFTSSWNDCVGFPTDSRIFKTGSSHHIKVVTEAAWVQETSFVKRHSDARRSLALSLRWSRIDSAQFRKWRSTKGESSSMMMLTVVWHPHGFHLIDVRPKGSQFHAGHDISHPFALTQTSCSWSKWPKETLCDWRWQCQTSLRQTATQFLDHNSLRPAPHPPYSPDLASSDFYLFAYLKAMFQGSSFDGPGAVLSAIQAVLRVIDRETMHVVFQ